MRDASVMGDANVAVPMNDGSATRDGGAQPLCGLTRSHNQEWTPPMSATQCATTCAAPQVCVGSSCCDAPATSGAFSLPAHTSWMHGFALANATELRFDVYVENDPGSAVGLYFAPWNGYIDGTMFYVGTQTNMQKPGAPPVGKGFLFSRWNTLDEADTRKNPSGYIELGTHEGEFAGVRMPYAWTTGWYSVSLHREAENVADGERDWFAVTVTDLASCTTVDVGALRFPRAVAGTRATIRTSGTGFTEVYSGALDFAQVPSWSVFMDVLADGKPLAMATSEYPAWPTAKYPNTNISYDAAHHLTHFTFGGQTPQCTPAGMLF